MTFQETIDNQNIYCGDKGMAIKTYNLKTRICYSIYIEVIKWQ